MLLTILLYCRLTSEKLVQSPQKGSVGRLLFFNFFLLVARYSNKKWQYIDILFRLYCACMLYMYHYWADMILYIVLVVLLGLKQAPCVPAILLCAYSRTKKALKNTLRWEGQNGIGRVTTNITFFWPYMKIEIF